MHVLVKTRSYLLTKNIVCKPPKISVTVTPFYTFSPEGDLYLISRNTDSQILLTYSMRRVCIHYGEFMYSYLGLKGYKPGIKAATVV